MVGKHPVNLLDVIAGLAPAIHVDITRSGPWMRGSGPRMTVIWRR
jgi:hypothetical protein